jgi:hypothetical protein
LTPAIEASGPHGFTVRRNIVRLRAVDRPRVRLNPEPALPSRFTPNAAASTASRPASLTIRIRPSVGRDGEGYIPESGEEARKNFGRKSVPTKNIENNPMQSNRPVAGMRDPGDYI